MKPEELKKILESHSVFLESNGDSGKLADFRGADLWGANLRGANLQIANLQIANFRCADLRCADLRGANLRGADLWGADLRGANLWGANLWGTTGNGREIKSIQTSCYPIAYTSTHMFIGCEGHAIRDWEIFTPEEIHEMGGDDATIFWNENKKLILEFISKNPATPVATENKK